MPLPGGLRPQLKVALHRLWRGAGTLQLGLDPWRGLIVDGLTAGDQQVVAALDGSRDVAGLVRFAATCGVQPARVHQLLDLLASAGVLVTRPAERALLTRLGATARARLEPDAAVWSVVHPYPGDGLDLMAARSRRCVAVLGAGRTGTGVATTLVAAGIGSVVVRDDGRVAADDVAPSAHPPDAVGAGREQSAERQVLGWRPGLPAGAAPTPSSERPDLVVLVGRAALDARQADVLLREDVPHLAVVVREAGVVIGPLVLPGRSACLRCLDLQRTGRDPGWPHLVSQLVGRSRAPFPEEVATATAAAGVAALQVLVHLDAIELRERCGTTVPPAAAVGATLELDLPDGLVSRRPWHPHPACGCSWPLAQQPLAQQPVAQAPSAGRPDVGAGAGETMAR